MATVFLFWGIQITQAAGAFIQDQDDVETMPPGHRADPLRRNPF